MYINEDKSRYDIRNDKERLPGLYVSHRQFSWITVLFVLVTFSVFVVGYFIGKHTLADSTYEYTMPIQVASTPIPVASEDYTPTAALSHPVSELSRAYYAQLVGFGTSSAAQKFSERLQRKNFPVRIKERHSTTAQGKKIIWYQIITEPFEDKDELLATVHRIKQEENLPDIRIIQC